MEKEADDEVGGMKEGNISLILDSYDDLFSDFDPRSYSERALSDDFLVECKRATRDKEEDLELRFLVPKQKRNFHEETLIRRRLKTHFKKHFHEKRKEIREIKIGGWRWFFLGVIVMIAATFLYGYEGFLFNFLFIMAEPAGWFLFWEGLDKIFIEARKKMPDYEFYRKMHKARIYFLSY